MIARWTTALLLAVLSGVAAAEAPHAHVHGVAELNVVVDGGLLDVVFESPLDNLIGFERAPRTDAERKAVGAMAVKLRKPLELFVPSKAARCDVRSVELSSPVLDSPLLGGPPAPAKPAGPKADKGAGEESGHAEINAHVTFRCADAAALKDLEVRVFAAFKGVQKVDAQVAGAKGQSAATLTPANRKLTLDR